MIDTVIFDLGKVLVRFDAYQGMLDMGFTEDEASLFMEKIFKGPWMICDEVNHTLKSIKEYFLSFVPGHEKSVDLLFEKLPLLTGSMPYAREWLYDLKKRGLKLYILSNYGNVAFDINKRVYDFLDYFDGGIISYELGLVKPDKRIYECLFRKYDIDPCHAVFIDDRKENVEEGIRLGMKGIVFDSYPSAGKKLNELLDSDKEENFPYA